MEDKNQIGKIEKTAISYEMFEGWIITALEGGSNYWYYIKDALPKNIIDKYKEEGLSFSELFARAIWIDKISIDVYDLENDEELLGTISMKSVKKGLESICEHHESIFKNLMHDNYDAWDADVFFQYIVMNELTFG